ncbi:MAG: hypothetical protein QOI21_3316 [Actinomycetota bacterium]|nr:hypothetical protein [Actinomycetota bacterium]
MTKPGQEPHFDAFSAPAEVSPTYGQVADDHAPEPIEPRMGRKQPGIVALAVVAALLLAIAGVVGGLYASEKSDTEKVAAQLADKERQLADATKQLQEATDQLTAAKDGKTTAENKNAGLARCGDAAKVLAAALRSPDENQVQVQDLSTALVILCN